MTNMATSTVLKSRAVERLVEPGNSAVCVLCRAPVKFVARVQHRQVIANVYKGESWDRVEHYHSPCYEEAGLPYGPAAQPPSRKR
ncbi:MAG: hypothetical protein M3N31_08930 [Actinomycetota bacterium]|nr:hypothetical protein [Actinomycetota bacterium]